MFQSIFICIFVFFQSDLDIDKLVFIGMANGIAEQEKLQMSVNTNIDRLAATKKGRIDPSEKQSQVYHSVNGFGATFTNKKEKAEWEDRITKEILEMKSRIRLPRFLAEDLLKNDPQKGGLYKIHLIRIIQIVGPDALLGQLPPFNSPRPTCYFQGIDTSSLVDGQTMNFNEGESRDLLYADGTHTYTTTLGASKTVFQLRQLTPKEVDVLYKEVAKKTPSSQSRTWLDVSGNNKTEAVLTSFDLRKVKLTKTDGAVIEIPISKLSKNDQTIVRIELGLDKFPVGQE